MNDNIKRYLIGCVIPVFATVLVCGIIFYQNAASAIFAEPVEEVVIEEGTVTLTKTNWEEYFEYVEEYVPLKNEAGEVERIEFNAYYRMKDVYYERLASTSENVILMIDMDDTFKEYKITDPKTGEWEFTGNDSKYESAIYKFHVSDFGNERKMCFWYANTNKCEAEGNWLHKEFEEFKEEMVVPVINEIEIKAVEGQVTFK